MAEPPVAAAPLPQQSTFWLERADRIRTITKWCLGAIAISVSLAVGLSPLTGIGSVEPGLRLAIAGIAALLGIGAMGWAFIAAAEVLKVRILDVRAIAESIQFTSLRSELDQMLRPHLPPGIEGVRQLVGRYFRARRLVENSTGNPGYQPTEAERNDIEAFPYLQSLVEEMTDLAGFVLVQDLFERFWKRLARCIVVTATAAVVFAWAATPPKADDLGERMPVDLAQATSVPASHGEAMPCAGQPGCCTGSADCAPPPAPLTQTIPADCVTMLVADGKATCVENDSKAGLDPRLGHTYALLRPGSFDLSAAISEAVAALAKSGRPASDSVLARNVAGQITAAFREQFGKPLASRLFERGTPVTPDQLNPVEPGNPTLNVWFSMAPPGNNGSNGGEILYQSFDVSPFDTESSELNHIDTWGPRLSAISDHAATNRCRVEIVGFADRRGTASFNLYLAMERASALQRWIMGSTSLPRRSINVYATGAFGLGCETDQASDLACNRHVEVTEFCGVGVTN